jgi:hypothetical protein
MKIKLRLALLRRMVACFAEGAQEESRVFGG